MSVPSVSPRHVSFSEKPLDDTKNPRPVYKSDTEIFISLLSKYNKFSLSRSKGDKEIKELAQKKLVEFAMQHPEYREQLPRELHESIR